MLLSYVVETGDDVLTKENIGFKMQSLWVKKSLLKLTFTPQVNCKCYSYIFYKNMWRKWIK